MLVAGYFQLADRAFRTTYRINAVAVHLYEYAASMRMDGESYELRSGDLTLTPAGSASCYDLPHPGRHWCIHVVPASAGPAIGLPRHLRLGSDAALARERFTRIVAHHRRALGRPRQVAGPVAAGAAALELLAWLADRTPDGPARRGDLAVERAAGLLRERPERTWQVAGLARTVGVSPAYLARRFRLRFGATLAHYQLVQRIGSAQALLACTGLAVGEIGRRVGLPDPHHFNKLFRRIAGQPPSVFRAAHRGP